MTTAQADRPGIQPTTKHVLAATAAALALALFLIPAPDGLDPRVMRAAAVSVFAIGFLATGALPEYFTAILFMFFAVALSVAAPSVVFSGFHSSAVWLVFGGLVIGLCVQTSGLGARIVRLMLQHFPSSYFGTVAALVAVGALLGFFIPSAMGRVMLLLPIVLVLAETLGFAAGSRGRNGLVLAGAAGTMFPAFAILPSNVPNMGLIGGAESIYGVTFTYGQYLALNFPVMGLLGLVFMPFLITALFKDAPADKGNGEAAKPWSATERRLLVVVGIALALWATDFAHQIAPAWVALGAGLLCLMPRIGLIPVTAITNQINFGPWFFVAGIIGMGAVVKDSGLGAEIAKWLLAAVPIAPDGGIATFAAIIGIGMIVAIVTTVPAAPAVMTPLAASIAEASTWPLESVLLAQVPTWMAFPFPYQAPPMVVAIALGGLGIAPALRFLLVFLAFSIVVLLPLQYLWGRLLGVYP